MHCVVMERKLTISYVIAVSRDGAILQKKIVVYASIFGLCLEIPAKMYPSDPS